MLEILKDKLDFLKKLLGEEKILLIYRFLSIVITSIFFIFNYSYPPLGRKVFIIVCLFISALILSYLYLIEDGTGNRVKVLLLIESIGNSLLLIPSGGLASPFIWYTFNTILISSVLLDGIYCFVNIFTYFIIYGLMGYFNLGNVQATSLFINRSNFILSLIMIIFTIQMWVILVKRIRGEREKIKETNMQLEVVNNMLLESIDHIKTLYQSSNLLTHKGNREGLVKLLLEYTEKITNSDMVFYCEELDPKNKIFYTNSIYLKPLEKEIIRSLGGVKRYGKPVKVTILNMEFLVIHMQSNYSHSGFLGRKLKNNEEGVLYKNRIYQLQFLSELITLTLERLYFKEVNERLLISEEQNRIANEIHDRVLQRLFSMSCGIFTLINNLEDYRPDEIKEGLDTIRKTTGAIMKELRKMVYGMSWKKDGFNSFVMDIKKYIDNIKKLHNITIPFSIEGDDKLLSPEQKKAFYRIICEGVGNAIKHGKATHIEINLKVHYETSILNIVDNGEGFNLEKVSISQRGGLGLKNMRQLTKALGGKIMVYSEINKGTRLKIKIPNNIVLMKGEQSFV